MGYRRSGSIGRKVPLAGSVSFFIVKGSFFPHSGVRHAAGPRLSAQKSATISQTWNSVDPTKKRIFKGRAEQRLFFLFIYFLYQYDSSTIYTYGWKE